MEAKGFDSASAVARSLGIHRNSISQYLNGKPVTPRIVGQLFTLLQLEPSQALQNQRSEVRIADSMTILDPVLSALCREFPQYGYLLFGSRARQDARRYSDADVGLLGVKPLTLSQLSKVKEVIERASEDLPIMVDLVDLGRADDSFLAGVRRDAVFIGGSLIRWADFLRRKND